MFSRSLLAAAANGHVAEIAGPGMQQDISHSIVQMKITAAICVPLMLGGSPAAFLYLDSRGAAPALRSSATAFCVALGRMASLALANLKRLDIEKRQAAMERAARRLKVDTIAPLLAALARLDALSKGIGRGSVWDELRATVLAMAGERALPLPVMR